MLQRLLALVAQGGVHSYADLAEELGVSEGLLEQMIEDLVRMEYLRPTAGDCQSQCAACPLARTCAIGGPMRVWTLTEKGGQWVEREHQADRGRQRHLEGPENRRDHQRVTKSSTACSIKGDGSEPRNTFT